MLATVKRPEKNFSNERHNLPAALMPIAPSAARQGLIGHPIGEPYIQQLRESVTGTLKPRALVPAIHQRASTVSLMAVMVPV